jgi:hypothetical protein
MATKVGGGNQANLDDWSADPAENYSEMPSSQEVSNFPS